MNREVIHEGWLIKSPPTKRIWRARWRRRWFTLKQGEIPDQYCLEYYTDRSCRKLKGIIDLDQCEQVDCGLRLEHRKQKFQFMFDVKTPRRTFYLAAESELDMHDWVNWICQVCNLQDLTKQCDRPYYNVSREMLANQPAELDDTTSPAAADTQTSPPLLARAQSSNTLEHASTTNSPAKPDTQLEMSEYQNNDIFTPSAEYTNLEPVTTAFKRPVAVVPAPTAVPATNLPPSTDYYDFGPPIIAKVEQQVAITQPPRAVPALTQPQPPPRPAHDPKRTITRKIPDNLTLTDSALLATTQSANAATSAAVAVPNGSAATAAVADDLSPALSTASGPYIAISDCFTGNTTPLNTLDPRFGVEWRSTHTNGVNQIYEAQPYSPKHSNVTASKAAAASRDARRESGGGGGRSSPSDPESVFSDDEEWSGKNAHVQHGPRDADAAAGGAGAVGGSEQMARSLRPSDSSVENDSMVHITYKQRFSKMPNGDVAAGSTGGASASSAAAATAKSVVEPWIEASAFGSGDTLDLDEESGGAHAKNSSIGGQPQSPTENASPAIGPKDVSCCVEENYDIPRSHQPQYHRMGGGGQPSLAAAGNGHTMAASTPNLLADVGGVHPYSNAAPTQVGNVFRFDFSEQENAPRVDRGLKPKTTATLRPNIASPARLVNPLNATASPPPPSIDRTRKPPTVEALAISPSLSSQTLPRNYNQSVSRQSNTGHARSSSTVASMPVSATVQQQPQQLDYLELQTFPGTATVGVAPPTAHKPKPLPIVSVPQALATATVYRTLDFVKTAAIHAEANERRMERE